MPPPVRDLALLSDCQSAALVTRDGRVAWWPAPRFDSPSAFSALLYDDAGLLAEEVDATTGEPLGNTPQAIAHVGLVNAAAALTAADERQVAA